MNRLPAFSLIETLLYFGIIGIMLTLAITGFVRYSDSQETDRERSATIENQQFLEAKLDYLLFGVDADTIEPTVGESPTLQITMANGVTKTVTSENGTVTLTTDDGITATSHPLLNNHATVTDLRFTRSTINNQPTLTISYTLTGKTLSLEREKKVPLL